MLLRVPNKLFSHVCHPFSPLTQKTNAVIINSKKLLLTRTAQATSISNAAEYLFIILVDGVEKASVLVSSIASAMYNLAVLWLAQRPL